MEATGLDQRVDAKPLSTEALLQALLATTRDGVVVVDASRQILQVNEAAADLLSLDADAAVGEVFLHPFSLGDTVEVRIAGAGDAVHLVEIRAEAVADDPRGAVLLTLHPLQDRQRFRRLEFRTERQLRDLQRMEALGALASALAHDYNNLFTVVLGRCELLERHAGALPGATAHLEQIRLGVERAGGLTSQFMALVDRGQTGPTSLDLGEVLTDLHDVMGASLGSSIRLEMNCASDLWPVRADRRLVEHAITNIVRNAREAIDGAGHVHIEVDNVELGGEYITSHQGVRPGAYVRVSISDDGCGVDPQVLPRAFEPFFTTKGASGSRGLGLTMAYGIAKEHGGNIWMYSEPELGTVVKLYLPRDRAGAPQLAPSPFRPRLRRARPTLSLLVVEDDLGLAETIESFLDDQGHTAYCAADGAAALRSIDRVGGTLDCILCDVVLPKLGGRDLVSRIRERLPHVPILMMSGYTDDEVVRRGLVDADAPYLQKPFTPEQLLEAIDDLV